MPLFRNGAGCAKVCLVWVTFFTGCSSPPKQAPLALRDAPPQAPQMELLARDAKLGRGRTSPHGNSSEIKTVSHEELVDTLSLSASDGEDLFSGQMELALPLLVSEVQQRNPSLKAALAAWGAAAERHPQVVALDDPMLQSMFAPASFSSSTVQSSYIVGVAQKIPWGGKRGLRGQVADWNAVAASLDYQEEQLRLAEAARLAYYDYYNVFRQLELNDAGLAAVQAFRETAKSKVRFSQAPEQDLLQADVELARIEQRRVEIDQARQVAAARINTLLHREPQLHLPPPPQRFDVSDELPDVGALREQAIEKRPDLAAQAARLNAEKNELCLAWKEFYPDFELMGRYDTFWTDPAQRGQVGLYMNIPLNQNRRNAAVREAMFRVNKMQAEYDQQVDMVRNEVQTVFARLQASRRTIDLYTGKLLPATRGNVSAANSGYEAGTIDFLRLVQAQREFIDLNEKYQQMVVEYYRNRAELDRVVGAGI